MHQDAQVQFFNQLVEFLSVSFGVGQYGEGVIFIYVKLEISGHVLDAHFARDARLSVHVGIKFHEGDDRNAQDEDHDHDLRHFEPIRSVLLFSCHKIEYF